MPFFKDLRRRSKASFNNDGSSNGSDESGNTSNNIVSTPSTSTLSSMNDLSVAPPPIKRSTSTLSTSQLASVAEGPPIPPRPANTLVQSKRNSVNSVYSASMTTAPKVPTSMYAPRVLSISDNGWVNSKVLLVYGQAGPNDRPLDGTLTVNHNQNSFPPTTWQVCDTHFKALIHLYPGPNDIRLDFSSPRLVGNDAPNALHTSRIRINYLPLNNVPPLQLAILIGKDSPGTFDSPPDKTQREGNDLELAKRKYRMTAHLWSAFTAEQMFRNGFGRRSFRFEEEYQTGTLFSQDKESKVMRNETKIHVIRSSKTVAEIRDHNVAQQNKNAKRGGDLFSYALEDVKSYFKPQEGQTQYVSVLILDSHWDRQAQLITGHAALGGGSGDIQLGIFGSQALHTYPSTIEEVVPAMTDCTKTDTKFVAADGGEDSGQYWQAACIGMGAHLHEVGHALGCPHQKDGIMLHDYWTLNRTFITAESYSTRTKQVGLRPCLPSSECGWHRLDILRFRSHPCFRLALDPLTHSERGIQVLAVEQGQFIITAKSGISFIELHSEGHPFCEAWIEYVGRDGTDPSPKQLTISEAELRSRLPNDRRNKKLRLEVFSCGGESVTVADTNTAVNKIKMPGGITGYLGQKLGASAMEGSQPRQVLISTLWDQRKLLVLVRVYHGFSLHGVEFIYEDGNKELFGVRSGDGGPKDFYLDVRRGESLAGFYVRAGFWIDGISIITSSGRQSEVFGNPKGGVGHTLLPPRGYRLAGLHGSCGPWVDGIGIVITR